VAVWSKQFVIRNDFFVFFFFFRRACSLVLTAHRVRAPVEQVYNSNLNSSLFGWTFCATVLTHASLASTIRMIQCPIFSCPAHVPSAGPVTKANIRKHATYFFGLVRARTSLYELKSRKVNEEHRIQKKLIPKLIFRRSEAQKNSLFFLRKVDKSRILKSTGPTIGRPPLSSESPTTMTTGCCNGSVPR